jgi:membrane-bound lytic murein transglycosylase B
MSHKKTPAKKSFSKSPCACFQLQNIRHYYHGLQIPASSRNIRDDIDPEKLLPAAARAPFDRRRQGSCDSPEDVLNTPMHPTFTLKVVHRMYKTLWTPPKRIAGIIVSLTATALVILSPANAFTKSSLEDPYYQLKRKLAADGFSMHEVNQLFDPAPPLQYRLISKSLAIRESRLDYNQFLTAASLSIARVNLDRYSSVFKGAERQYGVDRSVIAAILLVETRFGSYTGQTPTLAVLASYAIMNQPYHQDRIWSLLSEADRKRWGREAFEKRLQQRSEWAYPEVCALLRLSETQHLRVASLRGSIMGAFGWAQFLPSSLVRYGVDGDLDGEIDLNRPDDAIYSIANYLRGHGWQNSLPLSQRQQVIHHYNKSRPYVEAVLEIADRLSPL